MRIIGGNLSRLRTAGWRNAALVINVKMDVVQKVSWTAPGAKLIKTGARAGSTYIRTFLICREASVIAPVSPPSYIIQSQSNVVK